MSESEEYDLDEFLENLVEDSDADDAGTFPEIDFAAQSKEWNLQPILKETTKAEQKIVEKTIDDTVKEMLADFTKTDSTVQSLELPKDVLDDEPPKDVEDEPPKDEPDAQLSFSSSSISIQAESLNATLDYTPDLPKEPKAETTLSSKKTDIKELEDEKSEPKAEIVVEAKKSDNRSKKVEPKKKSKSKSSERPKIDRPKLALVKQKRRSASYNSRASVSCPRSVASASPHGTPSKSKANPQPEDPVSKEASSTQSTTYSTSFQGPNETSTTSPPENNSEDKPVTSEPTTKADKSKKEQTPSPSPPKQISKRGLSITKREEALCQLQEHWDDQKVLEDVNSLKQDKEKLQGEVNQKNEVISDLEAEVSNLKAEIEALKGEKFALECSTKIKNKDEELQSLEKMVEQLNADNAKLRKDFKFKQQDMKDTKQQMFVANTKLKNEISELKEELQNSNKKRLQLSDPFVVDEINKRKKQLVECQQRAVTEKTELKQRISDLEHALEVSRSRPDVSSTNAAFERKLKEKESMIRTLQTQLTNATKSGKEEVSSLQKKLTWYMDNQEVIDSLHRKIEEKEATICKLRAVQPGNAEVGLDAKEVMKLRRRVKELEQISSRRHGDTVDYLLKAMHIDEQEAEAKKLKAQIEKLEALIAQNTEMSMVKIRGLQQQHEKIQYQLQNRVSVLEKQLKNARKGVPARPSQQVRELENQIEDLRKFYNKKIKDIKKRAEISPKVKENPKPIEPNQVRDEETELALYSLRSKYTLLQSRYDEALKTIEGFQSQPPPTVVLDPPKQTPAIPQLKSELTQTTFEPEKKSTEVICPQLLQPLNVYPRAVHSQGAQTESVQKESENETMRKIHEFVKMTSQQLQESTLAKDLGAQLEYERANSTELKKTIMELEFQLNVLKTQPRFIKFQKLSETIQRLEQKSAQREEEFNKARHEMKAQLFLKKDLEIQRLRDTIKVKDAEIERLYEEIEKLMLKVKRLALSISKEVQV